MTQKGPFDNWALLVFTITSSGVTIDGAGQELAGNIVGFGTDEGEMTAMIFSISHLTINGTVDIESGGGKWK